MRLKKMLFKGSQVFVEVDDQGEIVLENGRALMRYHRDDERVYNPHPNNLSSLGAGAGRAAKDKKKALSLPKAATRTDLPPRAVIAYTDGACLENPGPAGIGYLVETADGKRWAGGEPLGRATNNIAELTAILVVLELLADEIDQPVVIFTDSAYAIGVLSGGMKAKANKELVATIRSALSRFRRIELRKVPGHSGVAQNEFVDQLAKQAAREQQSVEDQP